MIKSAEQAEIFLLLDASWRRKQYRPISGALWKWRNVSPTFYASRDLISNPAINHVAVIDANSFVSWHVETSLPPSYSFMPTDVRISECL